MTPFDLLLQQLINGLSLGAMYALLALGFTIVYGILELINFSHFNVFMVGSFIAMGVLHLFGIEGQSVLLHGLPLVGVLLVVLVVTMIACGLLGVIIERFAASAAARCEGADGDDHHHWRLLYSSNIVLLTQGANEKNYPNPIPHWSFYIGGINGARITVFQISDLGHLDRVDGRPFLVRAA